MFLNAATGHQLWTTALQFGAAALSIVMGEDSMPKGAPLGGPLFCVNIDDVRARFEKLGKRAKKLGVAIPSFEVVGQHEEFELRGQDQGKVYHRWNKTGVAGIGERATGGARTVYHVRLTGCDTVKFAGWSFLAVLDHELGEDNTVIRKAPGADAELPTEWKHKNNYCDHCKRNQARKQTFVCKHEDGRLVQVGSTCIKDFLGHDVTAALGHVEILALIREIFDGEDEMYMNDGDPKVFATVEFLAWTAKAIREGGWVSRKKAREMGFGMSTADVAIHTMLAYRLQCKQGR